MPSVTGKAQRQREELLEVAWTVAARDGVPACTYRHIAAEAGTSPTPFIHHFPTRRDLLLALLGRLSAGFDEARERAVRSGRPVEAIVQEGAAVLAGDPQSSQRRRLSLDLAFEGLRDTAVRRGLRARERERVERWSALVEEGRKRGEVAVDRSIAETVDQLGALLDGLALGILMYPGRLPCDHMTALWDDGARRLLDPDVAVPGAPAAPDHRATGSRARLLGKTGPTRREELLEVAFRVTARDGLAGLSFRALAGAAGTSTSPFTYAFGTRDGLLAEMVREIWAGTFEAREAAGRLVDPIDRFFAEWAGEFSDRPGQVGRERVYYELHHAALADEALAALLREGDEDGFLATLVLVEAGREQGRVRADMAPADLVDSLFALADGIGLRRVLLGERRPSGYRASLWEDGGRRILAP